MKEKILLLLMLFSATIILAQRIQGTIHFKDGTKKVGLVKYGPNPFANNILVTDKVKFKKTKESKNIAEYAYADISKIDVGPAGGISQTLYFKNTKKKPNILLDVQLVLEGKVSLYTHIATYNSPNGLGSDYLEYYVQKGVEDMVKIFPGKVMGISSEKLMQNYFEDCPKLVELVGRQAFKMYVSNTPSLADDKTTNRFIEVVKFYNTKCSNKN